MNAAVIVTVAEPLSYEDTQPMFVMSSSGVIVVPLIAPNGTQFWPNIATVLCPVALVTATDTGPAAGIVTEVKVPFGNAAARLP
jgi:hypothetical protein